MENETIISMALAYRHISQAELARKLNTTPSNLNQKIKRNTLTNEDMTQIATALGARWEVRMVFDDGIVIGGLREARDVTLPDGQ